jgi:hypothetical protein
MMEALKVMTYFKVSLSTHNWDSAKIMGGLFEKPTHDLLRGNNGTRDSNYSKLCNFK